MTAPSEAGGGELLVAIAGFAFLVALALPIIAIDIAGRMDELREKGVVSAALIEGKGQKESRSTKVQAGGGRLVSRNDVEQSFVLSFDKNAATRHSAFTEGAALTTNGNALPYQHTLTVGPKIYAGYDIGDIIMVTFLADVPDYDKDSFQLTEIVEQQSQPGFVVRLYLAAFALLMLGLWAGYRGWKQSGAAPGLGDMP